MAKKQRKTQKKEEEAAAEEKKTQEKTKMATCLVSSLTWRIFFAIFAVKGFFCPSQNRLYLEAAAS
jgi:hypothetical protein